MSMPSPWRIKETADHAAELRRILGEDADEMLTLDTLEGESGFFELFDRLLQFIAGNAALRDIARARQQMFERRNERPREALKYLMEAAGLKRVERALATATIAAGPGKVRVTGDVPAAYLRPDAVAIGKLLRRGQPLDWAVLDNAPPVLRIVTARPGAEEEEE